MQREGPGKEPEGLAYEETQESPGPGVSTSRLRSVGEQPLNVLTLQSDVAILWLARAPSCH